jgi:hypothetical protein
MARDVIPGERHLDRRWQYRCTFRYPADVRPPRTPGAVALQTVHGSESSMQIEVAVGRLRGLDVKVEQRGEAGQWAPYHLPEATP